MVACLPLARRSDAGPACGKGCRRVVWRRSRAHARARVLEEASRVYPPRRSVHRAGACLGHAGASGHVLPRAHARAPVIRRLRGRPTRERVRRVGPAREGGPVLSPAIRSLARTRTRGRYPPSRVSRRAGPGRERRARRPQPRLTRGPVLPSVAVIARPSVLAGPQPSSSRGMSSTSRSSPARTTRSVRR
jgi:hypothetical protein